MEDGLGPAKSKDFATSLGPIVVTPDEFDDSAVFVARVNGDETSRAGLDRMRHSWHELVAHAARNTRLCPGDVIASGSVEVDRPPARLQPGDAVELEVEGLGPLRNTVGAR